MQRKTHSASSSFDLTKEEVEASIISIKSTDIDIERGRRYSIGSILVFETIFAVEVSSVLDQARQFKN
jgi:hypothetical protein